MKDELTRGDRPEIDEKEWRDQLQAQRPRVARALIEAASRRHQAANKWQPSGARLTGLEQLLNYLDGLVASLGAPRRDRVLARLFIRMIGDFETALEAGLSGYTAVALDAMRDVMEATDLILLFSTDIDMIESWASTPHAEHWRLFSPAVVRRTLHSAGVRYLDDAKASVDYRGHSTALHVGPWEVPLATRGISPFLPLGDDAHFWEIYQHGGELLAAVERLRVEGNFQWPAMAQVGDMTDFAIGWRQAKEMEGVFLGLLGQEVDTSRSGSETAPTAANPDA